MVTEFKIKCRGLVTIEQVDVRTGRVIHRQSGSNLVVTAGFNIIRDLLYGDAGVLTYFAIGTSSTAAALGQTALVTEVFRTTITTKTKASAKLTCVLYLSSTLANGNTISEAGLFDVGGVNMYARYVLGTPIVKVADLAVTFTWELTWETP